MDNLKIEKTSSEKFASAEIDPSKIYAVKVAFTGNELLYVDESGQVKATQDLSFIRGYDATKTQTLKQVNGVLQWVNG